MGASSNRVQLVARSLSLESMFVSVFVCAALCVVTPSYGEVARSGDRNAAQLQEFLSRVNAHKKQLVEVKALMAKTKAAIQDNETHQTEERASAAMQVRCVPVTRRAVHTTLTRVTRQRKLLVEDAEIRKAIQEDERAKMEAEKAVFLKRALEEERERLRNETEKERAAINAKYAERTDEADEREKVRLATPVAWPACLCGEVAADDVVRRHRRWSCPCCKPTPTSTCCGSSWKTWAGSMRQSSSC